MPRPDTETNDSGQDPLIGKRLASYEVLARVARGGMGVVYRARHVYIDKVVALKVLDPALSSRPDLIDRFRTEAQSLARVEHENVVKVMDILEDEGVHFIVMDFAEGVNLRNHVKQNGPMPGDELLSVARQTAEALYAAHREGILHRDIKPENLIMNSRGRCKLADFGLAGDLRLISEGHEGPLNFGTPAYSAPEVLRKLVPDKRSDIFSFGATLYYLATGEPPFGQTGGQQILLRQRQGAELLEGKRPDLPGKLTRLIMDCLAWHPKERPENFREVMERLPRRAVSRAIPASGTSPTETTGLITSDSTTTELSPRTARMLTIAAVALAAASLLTVGLVWWFTRERPVEPPVVAGNQAPANTPAVPVNAANPPANSGDDGGTPTPDKAVEEAFNGAELNSRTAMARADYKGAWDAWSAFIDAHAQSEFVPEASKRRGRVLARVRELRESEFKKVRDAADLALGERRTADALAALNRFPLELLVPLSSADEVAEAGQLDEQRNRVLGAEAKDLTALVERADALRKDWQDAQARRDNMTESQLMRVAPNLLKERDMIEAFLPGRLADTQDRLGKRLAELRKLLEQVHLQAQQPVDAWRQFNDVTLGAWAQELAAALGPCAEMLQKRDFNRALTLTHGAARDMAKRLSEVNIADASARRLAASSKILARCSALFEEDIKLADSLHALLETELRELRLQAVSREFLVHAEIDANGERSARITKYTGRVLSVGNGEFVVDTEVGRFTLRVRMLTVASVRRIARTDDKPATQLALVAWLALQGRGEDALAEQERLEKMVSVTTAQSERGRELATALKPSPVALRTLDYLAAKAGLMARADVEAAHGTTSVQARLLAAQAGVADRDAAAAQLYVEMVRGMEDPELIHIATYADALALAQPQESDLRNRTVLEPFSADALSALAAAIKAENIHGARLLAGRALILDAGHEAAWEILK